MTTTNLTMTNKYFLGQRTGEGFIFQICYPDVYLINCKKVRGEDYEITEWDERFPEWKEKPVYFIALDEPRTPLTFEEFARQATHIKKANLREQYDKIPKETKFAIPEDGVTVEED